MGNRKVSVPLLLVVLLAIAGSVAGGMASKHAKEVSMGKVSDEAWSTIWVRTTAMLAANTSRGNGSNKPAPQPDPGTSKGSKGSTSPISIALHVGMINSNDPQLARLAEYENRLGRGFSDQMMLFTEIPASTAIAQDRAGDMVQTLNEYAKFGIRPLVILEPTIHGGQYFDLNNFSNGSYDAYLKAYFQAIKDQHITDAQMGTWVLFPEPNIPEWGIHAQTDPSLFTANYIRSAQILKAYFPGAQTSVMLNSQTYQPGDTDWANPSYASLVPYVQNIPDNLVNSFGFQGFPWTPPADQTGERNFDAASFLNPSLAMEAAKELNTKSIWFNTGTFGVVYNLDASQRVTVGAADRKAILDGVITQVRKAQSAGYSVTVNLFAQDKANDTSEGTDWSYLGSSDTWQVFQGFVTTSLKYGIAVDVFDTK